MIRKQHLKTADRILFNKNVNFAEIHVNYRFIASPPLPPTYLACLPLSNRGGLNLNAPYQNIISITSMFNSVAGHELILGTRVLLCFEQQDRNHAFESLQVVYSNIINVHASFSIVDNDTTLTDDFTAHDGASLTSLTVVDL